MAHVYGWALHNPKAKRNDNLFVTGISGLVALMFGVVSLSRWIGDHFTGATRMLSGLQGIDVSPLGF